MRNGKEKEEPRPGTGPRARGRPRTIDPEALIARAVEVFWAKGYEGASLDDLTRAMGVSRPTLYAAFGDKRTVFLAAIDAYARGIGSEPMAAFEAQEDIVAAVRAFLRVSLENNTAEALPPGCLIGCCASTSTIEVPGVAERIGAISTAGEHRLRSRFRRECEAGVLPSVPDAVGRAALLMDLMNAQAIRARAGASRRSLLRGLDVRVGAVVG